MKNKGINGVISIPCSIKSDFFRYWLQFLTPFHHLTPQETDVAASFLKLRHELSKGVTDFNLLNRLILNRESKQAVKEDCGIPTASFNTILAALRRKKFIDDGVINPKFIPKNIKDGDTSFRLLLNFNFNE